MTDLTELNPIPETSPAHFEAFQARRAKRFQDLLEGCKPLAGEKRSEGSKPLPPEEPAKEKEKQPDEKEERPEEKKPSKKEKSKKKTKKKDTKVAKKAIEQEEEVEHSNPGGEASGHRDRPDEAEASAERIEEEEAEDKSAADREVEENPDKFLLGTLPVRGTARVQLERNASAPDLRRPAEPSYPPPGRHGDDRERRTRERSRSRRRGTKGALHFARGRQRGYVPGWEFNRERWLPKQKRR